MNTSLFRSIDRMLRGLQTRVFLMLARGIVRTVKDDPNLLQQIGVDVLDDDPIEDMERLQDYGFSSNPPDGSECFVAFLAGNRNHGVVLRVDNAHIRLQPLAKGEVAMFTQWHGTGTEHCVVLRAGRGVEVYGAEVKIGDATATPLAKFAELKATFDGHTHVYVGPATGGVTLVTGPSNQPLTTVAATQKAKGT